MNFFQLLWQYVLTFFNGPGGRAVRLAIAGALQTVGAAAFTVLMDKAKERVRALEHTSLNNELRQADVRSKLRDLAAREGIKLSESLLNFILESAVQAVKAEGQ